MKIFRSAIADPDMLSKIKSQASDRFPDGAIPAGTLLSDNRSYLAVATADGAVLVEDLQLAGKKRMETREFLLGFRDVEQYTTSKGTSADVKKGLMA